MYSASFIFRPSKFDDEFHRLNGLVNAAANASDGYLGAETWQSANGEVYNAIYYWESLDALKLFSQNPHHLEAKKQYSRWYDGYQIVISEVLRSYGDDTIRHLSAGQLVTR